MGVDSFIERLTNMTHVGLVLIVFDNQSDVIKLVTNETFTCFCFFLTTFMGSRF